MGGNNSGRRPDPEAKPTVEEYSRWALDARSLGRNLSRPGTIFGYQWSRAGQPTGNRVLCAVYPDRLRLSYKVLQGEGEWERVSETIQLDTTVCRYGGQRYWFRCPRCHRRTRILYINKRPYCCRVCLGLAYQSQRELATDRNLERWQSLLCRLGGGGSISQQPRPRPKGMQRRVYRRLLEEIADARLNFWVSVAERFHIAGSRSEDDEDADD